MRIKQHVYIIVLLGGGAGCLLGVLLAPPDVITQLLYGVSGAALFGGIIWAGHLVLRLFVNARKRS
jgi:Sec-independent protein secretion pathway component TatC